jgi:hypothetical protein
MFDGVKPPPARRLRLNHIKHYDWIAIVASSWFPLPSQAFFLGYNRGILQYESPSYLLSK